MSDVRLVFRTLADRPPPFTDALFDVEVVNTETAPVWFMLPMYLDSRAELGPLLASSAEVFELSGRGRVRLARFVGNGSFQALRLAAGVRVTIRALPITLSDEPREAELAVPVMSAESLRIGDQTAEDWFTVDLLSSSDADVTFQPGAIVASQDTPGVRPRAVTMSGVQAFALCVRLTRR